MGGGGGGGSEGRDMGIGIGKDTIPSLFHLMPGIGFDSRIIINTPIGFVYGKIDC